MNCNEYAGLVRNRMGHDDKLYGVIVVVVVVVVVVMVSNEISCRFIRDVL